MAENKQLLLQLVNMLTQQLQGIGQQRQQGSQFRAGMEMNAAQMQFAKKQEAERAKESIADREIRLKDLNLRIKESETRQKAIDLGVQQEAKIAEWGAVSRPGKETTQKFTERVAGEPFKDVKDLGSISQALGILKNMPSTIQTAAAGPQATPGMSYPEFYAQETAQGAAPQELAGVARLQENLTPIEQELQNLQVQFMKGQITAQQYGAQLTKLEVPLAEYRSVHPEWQEPGYGYPRGSGPSLGPAAPITSEAPALSPEQQYQQDAGVLTRAGELGEEDLAAQVDSMIQYYKDNYSAGNASKEEIVALAASYGWTFNPADYSVADIFDGLRDHLIQRFRYKKPAGKAEEKKKSPEDKTVLFAH